MPSTASAPATSGLREPLPSLLQKVLRRAVHDYVTWVQERPERRQVVSVHVGVPGGRRRRLELGSDARWDHALRVEALEAMCRAPLERDVVPLVWLTRPMCDPGDGGDNDWVSAVGAASAELGVRLDLVIITRLGWSDPRSGAARSWTRVRPARARPPRAP